jgi:hypothetical protein
MSMLEEYRRNALECQRMADNARNPTDKASWLRLAASWLGMIKNAPERPYANEPEQRSGEASEPSTWPESSDEDSQASH